MKKRIFAICMVFALVLSGCSLFPQLQKAKDAYLATKVVEKLAEMDTEEPELAEPEETEPAGDAAEEEEIEKTVVTAEVDVTPEETEPAGTETPEEEPEMEETPEPTEEPEPEPTIVSDDPAVFLGDAEWVDTMDDPENWPVGSDTFTSASFEDGTYVFKALSEINGWRLASTSSLSDAYIEATVKMGECRLSDGYGIIFHVPEDAGYNRGYLFGITCDGRYSLRMWDGLAGEDGVMSWLKFYANSSLINAGANATENLPRSRNSAATRWPST